MTDPSSPSQHQSPLASLPASTFDFLPDLHALLQRVFNDELDPKDVAHESSPIRLKIQKARALLADLPEVNRSLEDQKKEIQMLEERIEKQRAILRAVAEGEVVREIVGRRSGREGAGGMEIDSWSGSR